MEINDQSALNKKMRGYKLRSSVNRLAGVLEQKGIKQGLGVF
jgi:hypothetical protein